MLCESCGTCAATKTWVNDRHRVPERHRLCTTCHDLVIEERRTAMGSSKRDPDNAKIANAILRALADSDLDAETIARKAMAIAAEICVYTNNSLTVETLATA